MYDGKIDRPEIKASFDYQIPDHQILLGFTDDEDAIMFDDWWRVKGWKAFQKWVLEKYGKEEGREG